MNIALVDVTKDYSLDDQTTVTPVHNVNLNIHQGEFILLIGRSGSGKTTLLNLAAGLIKPTSGKVLIDNVSVQDLTDGQLSLLRNHKIGFIFQFPSLLSSLTALENVALPIMFDSARGKRAGNARAANLLKTLGLGERMQAYPRQLSAGEQKRVVIARSLVNEPEVLLADEPTSDLDERTEQEIMGLLREVHATGKTIVMVTHSLELIPYATRALKVDNGFLADVTGLKGSAKDKIGGLL